VFIVQLSWGMAVAVSPKPGSATSGSAPATEPSWGLLLKDLQQYISVHPLSVVWPGLAITITVLGLNLLGDACARRPTDPHASPHGGADPHDGGDRMSLEVRDRRSRSTDAASSTTSPSTFPTARGGPHRRVEVGQVLTALAILGLLPDAATATGSIRWNERELIGLPDRELARLRGDEIGIVFQEPRTALNRSAPSDVRSPSRCASTRASVGGTGARDRRGGACTCRPLRRSSAATRTSSPAGSASAWPSPWPSPAGRGS
jgi:hypothetical protein